MLLTTLLPTTLEDLLALGKCEALYIGLFLIRAHAAGIALFGTAGTCLDGAAYLACVYWCCLHCIFNASSYYAMPVQCIMVRAPLNGSIQS